ncbi:MAG: hypothetical protein IJO08_02640 [Clostridia bacterium]|nr:hypothetical protein [Clostridia bacterium]
MKHKKVMAALLILCMCMAIFMTGCSENGETFKTATSSEGVISFYQTSNRDQFLAYMKSIDTSEYDILDVSSPHTTSFAVTTREKGKWKTAENTKAYEVAVLDGYYLFVTTNQNDYLNFLEQFEAEIYQINGISVNPGNSYYAVTYVEIKN